MHLFEKPIVMLDFETTGLSPAQGERITEVAALKIVDGKVVDRFVSLVNCRVRIPAFITQLTGITQSMVDNAPSNTVVMPKLINFIGYNALAAHNASFDMKFLMAEGHRVGLMPKNKELICSLMLSRRIFPGHASYKLGEISKALGIEFKGTAHRAEADAEVSTNLLIHIGEHLKRTYKIPYLDPYLLEHINKIPKAKVPSYLAKVR